MSRYDEWMNLRPGRHDKRLDIKKVVDCPVCDGYIELLKETHPGVYECICKSCEVTMTLEIQHHIDITIIKPVGENGVTKSCGGSSEKKMSQDAGSTPASPSDNDMFSHVTVEDNSRPKSIFTDGSTDGNPGLGACAIITNLGAKGHRATKYLGKVTNSVAEFEGVIMGLEFAQLISGDIILYSDSEFIVKVLNGEFKIRKEHLKPLSVRAFVLTARRENKGYKTLIIHCTHDENLAHEYAYNAMQSYRQQTQYKGKGD